MANYIENFASKLDWAMPFQRTGAFPLDRSNLFESLADAQLYAQGGADKRGLGGTSYVGQMIVVYENDVVTAYIINADRSLKAMASTASDGSSVQSVLDALNAHKAAYDAKVKELENTDKAISGRLNIIEGEANVEGSIKKALADAKADATAKDEALHTTISAEIDADVKVVSDALNGEITRAKEAEKANTDAIAAEKTRAEGEEERIEGLITAEATAREEADTALSDRIAKFEAGGEKDVSKLATDLAGEVSRAKAAEKENKDAITVLNGADTVEGSVKKQIKDAVGAEATLRETKDNELQGAINTINESLGATGSIGNRLSTVEGKATALEGRADTLEGKVSDLETAIGTKAVDADNEHGIVAKPATGLYKEVDDLKTADAALDSRLDSLEGIVGNAQSGLVKKVDDNTAAIAAINHETDGILAKAKKYTDDELDTAIGVAPSETVTGSGLLKDIADAKQDAKDYADQKIAALVNSAPATLDTLKELADALGNDANFSTTVTNKIAEKADKTYVNTELGKKVDKVEGSRLVTETEADAWDAKAEVSDVTQALTDAKGYTDSEIAKITTGKGSIGARLTAVEEKNTEQDTAIANAQKQADKGVADTVAEATRAQEAELELKNSIDAINNVDTGILATAKSYTNTEVKKVSDKVGNIDNLATDAKGSTVLAINELKGKIDGINEDLGATGSIGTRLNNLETTVGDAQSGLVKKVADNAAAIVTNANNITTNTNAIAAINNEQTGILAQAKEDATTKANNAKNDAITEAGKLDAALKDEIEGENSVLMTAIKAEAARATEVENSLSGKIDIINGEGEGSFKKAITDEKTARENADKALGDRIAKFEAGGENDVSKLKTDLANEVTRAKAAEKENKDAITVLNGADTVEGSVKKQIKDAINIEASARETKDNELQGAINDINKNLGATGSIGTRLSAVEGKATALEERADVLEAIVGHEAIPGGDGQEAQPAEGLVKDVADLKASINTLNGAADVEGSVAKTVAEAVAGEASLREAADTALDGRLDIIEASIKDGGALESRVAANEDKLRTIQGEGEGSIKKALEDAKAHTNTAVANLVNSAPETLDTLQELANALGNDPSFATTVATQIGKKADTTYVNEKLNEIKNGEGSIGTRLTAVEEKNTAQDKAITKAQTQADKGVADVATEKARAEAAEGELKTAIDNKVDQSAYNTKVTALEKADTDNLATAKSYADTQDTALHTAISSEIDADIAAEAKLRSDADTALSNRIANKADKEHGNHVPETQDVVSNKVFLRNDNTWAEVTPANIGAAATNHGTHVTYAIEQPKAPGKPTAGISEKVAREDHVHPSQTTITGNAGTATKLATARAITVKGDATGSVSFDGSADKDLNLTLSNSGVATGSYGPTGDVAPNYEETFVVPQVTVDIKGRVTSATNRTITLPAQTVYENATSSKAGLMSTEDKTKLDGIEANANNYTHPENHPASMITESADKRFVSDAEKDNWDAKETTDGAQSKADAAAANALNDAKTYADTKIASLVNSAPETLDTLKELADALGNDANFATTVSTEIGKKADKTYVDGELAKITTGDGSIGARLTAVETKNTDQDKAISTNATNLTAEINRAKAAEEANATNIANNKSVLDKLDGSVTTEGSVKKQIKDAIDGITTGDGSIGGRLTAVEAKNTVQDEAITNAQNQADKGVADAAAEVTRATAAEKVLTDNLAAEVSRAKAAEKTNSDAITVNSNAITANSNAITVLNGDSTVEGSVDKKIADNNIFDTDILTVNALGGIGAGENLNGMTIEAVLKKLLYPYVAHLVSASSTPNGGVFECGNNQTVTAITANITKKSEPITKVEFVDGSNVLETKTDGIAAGGSVTHSCSIIVSTNDKSFTVNVTDKSGNVVTATTGKFTFVYPYYWGVCSNDATIDEAMVKGLTKKVETKGSKSVIYTANFQRAVIAYPATYGDIRKILDPNSFDVTATFTKHSINVTGLDGKSVAYYVYVNSAFTATNFKFTFSY